MRISMNTKRSPTCRTLSHARHGFIHQNVRSHWADKVVVPHAARVPARLVNVPQHHGYSWGRRPPEARIRVRHCTKRRSLICNLRLRVSWLTWRDTSIPMMISDTCLYDRSRIFQTQAAEAVGLTHRSVVSRVRFSVSLSCPQCLREPNDYAIGQVSRTKVDPFKVKTETYSDVCLERVKRWKIKPINSGSQVRHLNLMNSW